MRSLLSLIVIFGVFASLAAFSELNSSPTPTASPSVSPSPSGTPTVEVLNPITSAEAARLRREFKRALKDQLKNLEETQKRIRKESKAARKRRFDEWSKEQNVARRKFFETNLGPARRAYMKDLIQRREAFLSAAADEEKREKQEHAARKEALEIDQAARLKEFETFLKNNQRPPDSLWR